VEPGHSTRSSFPCCDRRGRSFIAQRLDYEKYGKKLVMEPLCSLEDAEKKFEDLYLNKSHVKLRLAESTQVLTPEGARTTTKSLSCSTSRTAP